MSATPSFGRPGVSDETLASAGCHHVSESECQQRYGFRAAGIAIPFFALNGEPLKVGEQQFARVRLYEPRGDQKYAQAKDSGVHLYIPPLLKTLPAGGWLVLTEGEFKALALVEAGFNAVGLCGICGACHTVDDNDTKRHVLLPELRAFLQERRYARLVFLGDGDVVLNHHFAKEAAKLANALADLKVELRVAKTAFGGPKGVDDFRQEHKEEFTEKFEQVLAESLAVSGKEAAQLFVALLRREEEQLKQHFKAKPPEDTYDQRRKLLHSAAAFAKEPILGEAIKEMVATVFGQSGREVNKALVQLAERAENTAPAVAGNKNDMWQEDLEPWPEPVDGKELMRETVRIIGNSLVASDEQIATKALWSVYTYAYDWFGHAPILLITSPTMRCGKTQALRLLTALVRRPLPTGNCTPAPLFRAVDEFRPTVLIDEADTFMHKNEELRGLVNVGFQKWNASVLRCVGDDFMVKSFNTWCPKAIAAIGTLASTIMDRSIVIRLQRAESRLELAPIPERPETLELRRKWLRWCIDHEQELRNADPYIPKEIRNDRYVLCWRPLLAIADAIGGHWPEIARRAMVALAPSDDNAPESPRELLLRHIKQVFDEDGVEEMPTDKLLERLCGEAEWPWREYNHGRGLNGRRLADMLKEFGIYPRTIGRGENKARIRGYRHEDFEEAWSKYCPGESTSSGGQVASFKINLATKLATSLEDTQPLEHQGVSDNQELPGGRVANSNGGSGEEENPVAEPVATASELSADESW